MAKELELTFVLKKEKGGYSALCPELDVASQGKTVAEAKEHLKEAIEGFLLVAKQEGILDEVLENAGLSGKKHPLKIIRTPVPFQLSEADTFKRQGNC